MKSLLILARRNGKSFQRLVSSLGGVRSTNRYLATLPQQPPPTSSHSVTLPYAVDSPDGTCKELDAAEEQRLINEYVETEAEHAFCRHLEKDHVDFYGPQDGPLHATHPTDPLSKPQKRVKPISPQHLLAVTEEDVTRTQRQQFLDMAVYLEDLHFNPNEKSVSQDPDHYAAVDSPDGTSDDVARGNQAEVDHWIAEAARHEDKDFVERLHAQQADAARIFAVEGPDGESDDVRCREYEAVQDIVETEACMHDPAFMAVLHHEQHKMAHVYAVDSPDGTPDDIVEDDLHRVEDIIEYAAEHEDKQEVLRMHKENQELKETLAQNFPKGPFNLP